MGYTLKIGNAKPYFDEDNECEMMNVDNMYCDLAPAYGEPTDHSNARWPSYSSWAAAMRFVGLYDLFFDRPGGLLNEHPGYAILTKEHQHKINTAYAAFYKKYPNCNPGYSPLATDFQDDLNWPVENTWAARLEWLKYWVDYALDNCEKPIFYNS